MHDFEDFLGRAMDVVLDQLFVFTNREKFEPS